MVPIPRPVVDFLPGYRVIRCFVASSLAAADARDFADFAAVEKWFRDRLDHARRPLARAACGRCESLEHGHCLGGCIGEHLNKYEGVQTRAGREERILLRIRVLYRAGRLEEARAWLEQALDELATPGLVAEYANCLLQVGDVARFVRHVEENEVVLRSNPSAASYFVLARYSEHNGYLRGAIGQLRRALRRAVPDRRATLIEMIQALDERIDR